MEDDLNYHKINISTTTGRIFPKFETKVQITKPNYNVSNEDDFKLKMSSNIPLQWKNLIAQKPLVGSSQNFKLMLL